MIKSALIYFPGTLLPRLTSLTLVVFGARIFSPEEYGYFALVIVIGEMLEMACTNWTRIALLRFSKGKRLNKVFVKRLAKASLVSVLCAVPLSSIFIFFSVGARRFELFCGVAIYLVGSALNRFGLVLLQAQDRKLTYSSLETVRSLLSLLLTVTAMNLVSDFFPASLVVGCVAMAAGVVAVYLSWREIKVTELDNMKIGEIVKYGFPLVLISSLSYVITSLDKMMVSSFHGTAAIAMYSVAFALGKQGFDVAANALNMGGFPRLVEEYGDGDSLAAADVIEKQLAVLLSFGLPAAIVLFSLKHELAELLFAKSYVDVIDLVVPFVAVGALSLNCKNFVFDNVFHLFSKNLLQVPSLLMGSCVSIVVGFLLLPAYGILGASLMFLSGSFASLFLSFYLSQRLLKIKFPFFSLFRSSGVAGGLYLFLLWLKNFGGYFSGLAGFLFLGGVGMLGIGFSLFLQSRSVRNSSF